VAQTEDHRFHLRMNDDGVEDVRNLVQVSILNACYKTGELKLFLLRSRDSVYLRVHRVLGGAAVDAQVSRVVRIIRLNLEAGVSRSVLRNNIQKNNWLLEQDVVRALKIELDTFLRNNPRA